MKKKMIALGALVLAVVVTGYSVSGTYAKYTSDYTASATAKVAKWAFSVGGTSTASATQTFSLDLFKDAKDNQSLVSSIVEGKDNGDYIIAPGSTGTSEISIQNNSDVKALIDITLSKGESVNVPLKFNLKLGEEYLVGGDKEYVDITAISSALASKATELTLDGTASKNLIIGWQWAYEGDNGADTALGAASASAGDRTEYKLDVTIKATQVAATAE